MNLKFSNAFYFFSFVFILNFHIWKKMIRVLDIFLEKSIYLFSISGVIHFLNRECFSEDNRPKWYIGFKQRLEIHVFVNNNFYLIINYILYLQYFYWVLYSQKKKKKMSVKKYFLEIFLFKCGQKKIFFFRITLRQSHNNPLITINFTKYDRFHELINAP